MKKSNALELLNAMENEISKLLDIIQESSNSIFDELDEKSMLRKLIELHWIREVIDKSVKVLVASVNDVVTFIYGTLALTTLHLTIYPCYWPSRYLHEGEIPPEILDEEVLNKLYEAATILVNFIKRSIEATSSEF